MKCNNCGGTLKYDIANYGLVCESCGSVKHLHRPEEGAAVSEFDLETALNSNGKDWGVSRRLVTCKSCGANMLYAQEQMSGMCPFCGSAIVLSAEDADCGIAPNAIIPFTLTKEQVAEKFYRWNKFALWSPEKFRRGKLLSDMTAIYIPYWVFETDSVTTYSGRFGYNVGSDENRKTNWYSKSGIMEKHISDHIVCGSKKFFENRMLNSTVSFRSSELLPYDPEILAGMSAELYTISAEDAWNLARTKGLRREIMESTRVYEKADYTENLKCSTEFSNIRLRYVLVPAWLAGCRYNGKVYNVVASGTNGRGNCNRPLSIPKLLLTPLLIIAYFMLGNYLGYGMIFFYLGIFGLFAALAIYVIVFMITFAKQRDQERKDREKYYSQNK